MCLCVCVLPLFNTACHNVADKVLIRLWLTLLYTTTGEMDMDGEKEKAGLGGWMDGWIDGWTGVCI